MKRKYVLMLLALVCAIGITTGCENTGNVSGNALEQEANIDVSGNQTSVSDSNIMDASMQEPAIEVPEGYIPAPVDPQEYSFGNGYNVKYSAYDLDTSFDYATDQLIVFDGANVHVTDPSIEVSGNQVIIRREGTYILQGTLANGQIIVNAGDEDKVHLVLDGASLTSLNSAPIIALNADKVILTLADGTDNQVTDGFVYNDEVASACIYAKCDLSINGNGFLTVTANYNNGIASKDDIKIASGNITIAAVNNGIKGKDSISIVGGNVTITECEDGIKTDNDKDTSKGYIYLGGGSISISANDDSIQATNAVVLEHCYVYSRCYGKVINCEGYVAGEDTIKEWM